MSQWDSRFAADAFVYGEEPNEFLREECGRFAPQSRVLNIGDGEGRNGVFLAERGHHVTSLDLSAVGLAKAARLAAQRGVPLQTLHADLAEWRAGDGSFDVVVSVFCHVPRALRRTVHADLARVLAPGGLFVLTAYRPEQLSFGTGGPKDLDLLFPLAELREELSGLELLVAREVERDVVEGTLHTGRAATVEVVARRS
ncbi:MAG: class I SAM-dependent methyltransferase [Myxococcales bacterium]|nr:class I SAM-dependent methyltransferase [Myxococcales bacterium]